MDPNGALMKYIFRHVREKKCKHEILSLTALMFSFHSHRLTVVIVVFHLRTEAINWGVKYFALLKHEALESGCGKTSSNSSAIFLIKLCIYLSFGAHGLLYCSSAKAPCTIVVAIFWPLSFVFSI